jgi:hypothetical protein
MGAVQRGRRYARPPDHLHAEGSAESADLRTRAGRAPNADAGDRDGGRPRVNPRQLSFAKAPFKRFQFLRFGRRTVATDQLSHATVAPRLLGLERVMIEGKFGKAALLFDTKARRNAFVFAIQARNSSFKFYRM